MKLFALPFAVLATLLVAAGCEGGGGSVAGSTSGSSGETSSGALSPAAPGQEEAFCEMLRSRATGCGSGSAQECEESGKCIYGRFMAKEVFDAYAKCRTAPSCGSDDSCIAEAARAVTGSAATSFSMDCVARRTACGGGSFKDDHCGSGIFAFPDAPAQARACLSEPCERIDACFKELPIVQQIAICKK